MNGNAPEWYCKQTTDVALAIARQCDCMTVFLAAGSPVHRDDLPNLIEILGVSRETALDYFYRPCTGLDLPRQEKDYSL